MEWPETKVFLTRLYDAAVAAAHPANCLPAHLPAPPARGNVVLLAAGKAAGSMAEIAEAHYLDGGLPPERLSGIAVGRHGYGRPLRRVEMMEAGHPVPDQAGIQATDRALLLAHQANEHDLVLVLLSGGASANWIAPARGISLDDKRALTRALLASGANIVEINTVRKHLSRIKGGRLTMRAVRARVLTLAISDVPGDDPSSIGSGPTVPDATTLADSESILRRYKITPPISILQALSDPRNETPKPGDPVFQRSEFRIIARPLDALTAAATVARKAGIIPVVLGDSVEGEARDVAAQHADQAIRLCGKGKPSVVLSGGELTVTMRGNGRGGPNQEYALALALALNGTRSVSAISGDTDGTDGGGGSADDPAGAYINDTTLARARTLGLDPARFLANNDSTGFFERMGDLLTPGPTFTNVNDLRAVFVDT